LLKSQKQTHSGDAWCSTAVGQDALRPSPGAAFFSQIQEREERRTALSRSGRGAENHSALRVRIKLHKRTQFLSAAETQKQTHSSTQIALKMTKRSQITQHYQ
jgi:hypothetical protein